MFETTSEGFITDGVFRVGSFGTISSTQGNRITKTGNHPASLTFDHGGSPTLEMGSLPDKCIIGSNNNQSENLHIQTGLTLGTLTGGTTRMEFRTDGEIRIPGDNQKVTIGAGQDLQLYHNGTHNYIYSYNGNLELRHAVGGADEPFLKAIPNGAVEISQQC